MKDFVYSVNNKNALMLQSEYSLDNEETDFIYKTFWPIIILNKIEIADIESKIEQLKIEFEVQNKVFDIEIFNRNYLNLLKDEIKEFLEAFNKGKVRIWYTYGDTNFIEFSLPLDEGNSKTLLLTDKDEVELELFFKDILKIIEYINETSITNLAPLQLTKSDKLKIELSEYGFFELTTIKALSENNKQNLINIISANDLPYKIAMFDYLGFLKHLEKEYFQIKNKLYKEVSKWFDSDKDGRNVKGNIYVLSKSSKEDKTRYTAFKHKEKVIKDYEQLK